MHEATLWPCIFGCSDCVDYLIHYLECSAIWQIANEILGFENSVLLSYTLCICEPSAQKLRRLTLVHTIYHFYKFDMHIQYLLSNFISDPSSAPPWHVIQDAAYGIARAVKYMVL